MSKKLKRKITKLITEAIYNAAQKIATTTHPHTALLNDKETANILGIAEGTLPVWRHHGKGPRYVKIGSNARYQYSDLLDYIASQKSSN